MLGEVIKLDRKYPLVAFEDGSLARCEESAELKKRGEVRAVVGDKVEAERPEGHEFGMIVEILPRSSSLVRKDPTDRTISQVLAANFDQVVIVEPIDRLNLKRIERELVLAHETGADVAVVLTKKDSIDAGEANKSVIDVRKLAGNNVPVAATSIKNPDSISHIKDTLFAEKTSILLGQSGAGKSSLINAILGRSAQAVADVRSKDGKGRHTTVSREIIAIPGLDETLSGRIVDMPGVRGLGLWEAREGMGLAFSDVEEIAEGCRFRDCKHGSEPGCAVRAAIEAGMLDQARLDSYLSLQHELEQTAERRRRSTWKNK